MFHQITVKIRNNTLTQINLGIFKHTHTVFPHIIAAAVILFRIWKL